MARRNKLSQSIYRETCETESYEIKGLWLVLVLLTIFESWKIFLVNVVTISMMSAKVAALSLLKIKAFWSHKFCPWRHQQNLPCDSNYIADTAMRPKFSKCSISMREVTITSVLHRFHQKNQFFEGQSWFKLNNLGLALRIALIFYINVTKGLKLSVRKFWWFIHNFVGVTRKKLVGEVFLHLLPSLYPE